ncbi:hypothetical protein AB6A40_007759 [Gnathostoma spinigerum]|uniref:Uncharacterized protein n=1 Tax=Gnathostoma spinigerum TaxID=75299 RepID=A0ABD6EM58_9BILA
MIVLYRNILNMTTRLDNQSLTISTDFDISLIGNCDLNISMNRNFNVPQLIGGRFSYFAVLLKEQKKMMRKIRKPTTGPIEMIFYIPSVEMEEYTRSNEAQKIENTK